MACSADMFGEKKKMHVGGGVVANWRAIVSAVLPRAVVSASNWSSSDPRDQEVWKEDPLPKEMCVASPPWVLPVSGSVCTYLATCAWRVLEPKR